MSKNYLKLLELNCRKFKKEHSQILDIIVYGSLTKGKYSPGDIDIMVLFLKISLKERLDVTQKLKNLLKKDFENIDIKSMNMLDFFDSSFLARQNILIEGISLIKNKPLSELFGFKNFVIFTYNLANLPHNEKIRFNYALNGRDKAEGVLQISEGVSLGKGVVQVPMKNSIPFEEFLQKWNIKFKKKYCLISYY